MGSKSKTGTFSTRNILLIAYIGICVAMVVATMGMSFLAEADSAVEPTAAPTATLSPSVQTMQAEDYQPVDEDEHTGTGQRAIASQTASAATSEAAEATEEPEATEEAPVTPNS